MGAYLGDLVLVLIQALLRAVDGCLCFVLRLNACLTLLVSLSKLFTLANHLLDLIIREPSRRLDPDGLLLVGRLHADQQGRISRQPASIPVKLAASIVDRLTVFTACACTDSLPQISWNLVLRSVSGNIFRLNASLFWLTTLISVTLLEC